MSFLPRLTLTARLTLLALLTLVPLLVLVVLADLEERDSRRDAAEAEARTFTQNVAASLDGFARDIDAYLSAAALQIGGDRDGISHQHTGPYLQQLMRRYPNVDSLIILDREGRIIATDDQDATGVDLSYRPYFIALNEGAAQTWSGGMSGLATGEVVAAYGRPIDDPAGATIAYIVAIFSPSNLSAALGADFPNDANFLLVDQDGQVIFSAREPDLKPEEKYVTDAPLFQSATQGLVEFDNTESIIEEGERYGAFAPVRSMRWITGYTRSQDILDSSLRTKLLTNIAIAGGIALLSGVALVVLAQAMTRPLRRLAAAASDVARGTVTTLPAPGRLTDPDVATLQRSFREMVFNVQDRETRLVEQARTLATLEQMGAWIASGLDFDKTLQAVADAGVRVTEAQFGAFVYNREFETGGEPNQVAASGIEAESAERVLSPAVIEAFPAVFRGGGIVRVDDITDLRYVDVATVGGRIRSLLALPVISGSGETLGALFLAHEQPGAFSEADEKLASGIASWGAIALDNARLYANAQQIQEELRQSNQSKDEFLGVVSHELRTPVTTIYGGLRLLEGRFQRLSSEDALDLISSMAEEGSRLVRLIENLLAFARLELDRPIDTQSVNVEPMVERVIESFQRLRPGRVLEVEMSPGLPQLTVEPTYFEQVLQNLISNADKYSPSDQPIHVRTRIENGEAAFVVSDHGPGVSEEEIGKIFEGFYRSESTSTKATGHGLGLTVCKRLVERQGGRIWATNLPRRIPLPCPPAYPCYRQGAGP